MLRNSTKIVVLLMLANFSLSAPAEGDSMVDADISVDMILEQSMHPWPLPGLALHAAGDDSKTDSDKNAGIILENSMRPWPHSGLPLHAADISVEAITAAEPSVQPGFPPLPHRVDLLISSPINCSSPVRTPYIKRASKSGMRAELNSVTPDFRGDFGSNDFNFVPGEGVTGTQRK